MKTIIQKIILVDDQTVENELLKLAMMELGIDVDIIYFKRAQTALDYLRTTNDKIFLIISDINMPEMSGLDFKRAIDADPSLSEKTIPFIFLSSEATRHQLREAYDYRLQGYFIKPYNLKIMAKQIETIINYWLISVRPDSEPIARDKDPFI